MEVKTASGVLITSVILLIIVTIILTLMCYYRIVPFNDLFQDPMTMEWKTKEEIQNLRFTQDPGNTCGPYCYISVPDDSIYEIYEKYK